MNSTLGLDALADTEQAFSSKSSWYKAPPRSVVDAIVSDTELPEELVIGLPTNLHEEAITLLNGKDIVALTDKQAERLLSGATSNALIQKAIERKTRMLTSHPLMAEELHAQLTTLRAWRGNLSPYLIKAVSLRDESGFTGWLNPDYLLIIHASLGLEALPMKNIPVVVFLPQRPQTIYTDVTRME